MAKSESGLSDVLSVQGWKDPSLSSLQRERMKRWGVFGLKESYFKHMF